MDGIPHDSKPFIPQNWGMAGGCEKLFPCSFVHLLSVSTVEQLIEIFWFRFSFESPPRQHFQKFQQVPNKNLGQFGRGGRCITIFIIPKRP